MDSDGLPLVGPGIDLTKVSAINQKRVLAFLNHYLTNTVQYLNRFSCVCEEKLTDLTIKIQRLETTMSILESKLSSIPGLENVKVAPSTDQSSQSAPMTNGPTSDVNANAVSSSASTSAQDNASQQAEAAAEEPTEPEVPKMTMKQHPTYAQYFKMLNMGVPDMAVKLKMSSLGLDPSVLDNPDAPAPDVPSSQPKKRDDDSDDFSDDDDDESSSNQDDSDAFSD